MQTKFYPTDIQYTVNNGKAVIQLYGRTTDGKQLCVLDENFEPYFYATGDMNQVDLETISEGEYRIVRVEKTRKRINEHEQDAWRLVVNLPKAVPILKDKVKDAPGCTGVHEYDILYTRRYLIDKQITPLTITSVEGEEVPMNMRVPCINAARIANAGADTIKPRILALDIETYNPDNTINMHANPIIMVGLYGDDFSRVVTWKRFNTEEDYIEFVDSEADMLQRFAELVDEYKPDFITGYFTDGFDFPYLDARAKQHKIKLDLGLDYSTLDIRGKQRKEARIRGIAHLDIYKFIRKVFALSLKTDSYKLDEVSKELLGSQKHDVDMEQLAPAWDEQSDLLDEFAIYNLQDCKLTYDLTHRVFSSLVEFVRIINLPPYDINRMTFSTYVEWYLISQTKHWNAIIPNRPTRREEFNRHGDRIKGAFVFEPTPGFYKDIVIFDYRSLYPSIIASHNISKGTLNCKCCKNKTIDTERGTFWYCDKQKGFFSAIIEDLILRRAEIKQQMKQDDDPFLAARSTALKILANSFYGYLGFAPARWYCIECAESTTAWARYYIHQAIDTATDAGFDVLYSDTDSIFLLLGKRTKEDAVALVDGINDKLPGLMELEYEGHYPAGLFVSVKAGEGGAKKKYALIDDENNMKIRGFETVRRNWSFIAKDTQQEVLRIILQEHDEEKARQYVRNVIDALRANKVPLNKLIIHTALSKSIDAYTSIGPHVAAAKRMEARGERVGAGTLIDYIVAKGEGRIRDKVKLPDEITQDKYDGEYYIQNQIIPGVERIFAVLGISVEEFSEQSKQTSLGSF